MRSVTVIDFEADDVLEKLGGRGPRGGVTLAVTDPDPSTGKRWLEVRVAPFDEHKNLWPAVFFISGFFPTPFDATRFSYFEMMVRNMSEGLRSVELYFSSLPYNDGGRNLEGDQFAIPAGMTWQCLVPMERFSFNDPSAIQLFAVLFRPTEKEAVYRLGPLRAVYDPARGCPAEKMKQMVADLQTNYTATRQRVRWSAIPPTERSAWEQKFSALGEEIRQLDTEVKAVGTLEFIAKFKATHERAVQLSRRLGQFLFAERKDFVAWTINPYLNIYRDEYPDLQSVALESIEVCMAGNEFRNTCFMVSPCGRNLQLQVQVAGLPPGAVELFETAYLPNTRNEETGDALYPLEESLPIPNGESRQITLRFNTRTTRMKPGTYRFTVILRDASRNVTQTIPGTLTVWDFSLPDYSVLPCNGYTELDSSEFPSGELAARAVADMKTFGMNVVYVNPVEMPKITKLDENENVREIDASRFETRLLGIVNTWRATPGRERLWFIFSLSGMMDFGVKGLDQPLPNPRWRKVAEQWLKAFEAMLAKYGLGYEDWFFTFADEASEAVLLGYEIPAAEAMKEIDPRIRVVTNTSTVLSDPRAAERFHRAFDIFQPHLREFKSRPEMRAYFRKANKPIWTYQCLGGYNQRSRNTYEYYRVYGWELVKFGITGTGVWTYCAQATAQRGGGYIMVYKHPQRNEVVHSRRFEFLREGIDDYRYIWKLQTLAKSRGTKTASAALRLIRAAVDDVTAHPQDVTRADHWRKRLAAEILRLQKAP